MGAGRGGFRVVVQYKSSAALARKSSAALGLALPGCASRSVISCGLAQQRRETAQFSPGVDNRCGSNTAAGFVDAIDMLTTHRVAMVGVEGPASWGAHIAIAVVAAGFDAREVPAQRSVSQRRARRVAKTDTIDSRESSYGRGTQAVSVAGVSTTEPHGRLPTA